jgi:hypothetical protein
LYQTSPSEPPEGADVEIVLDPEPLEPRVTPLSVPVVVAIVPPEIAGVLIVGLVRVLLVRVAAVVRSVTILVFTKAVVAICVVLVPSAAVGAKGVPVSVGDAELDLLFTAVAMLLYSVSISEPRIFLFVSPVERLSLTAKFVLLV